MKVETVRVPVEIDLKITNRVEELEEELAKVKQERDDARAAFSAYVQGQDPNDHIAKTLTIIGIPATELRDIFHVEQWYRRHGGTPHWLRTQKVLVAADKLAQACLDSMNNYIWHSPVWPVRDAIAELRLAQQEAYPPQDL